MVSIEEIKTAIVEREEQIKEVFKKEKIIERENIEKVRNLVKPNIALIITGVRRCGKSIFAFMLKKENFGYVNFEDERLNIRASELNKVLEAIYSLKGDVNTIIFDEIQNVEGWEKFIARLISDKRIIITGSNARLMSKELATFLTGRHIDYTLFPFSFREFLKFKEFHPNIYLTKDIANVKNYLEEYAKNGGFPLTHKIGRIFLIENYKDIVERDVFQRYKVKYIRVLKDTAKYLISNIGNEISFNKLKNIFDVNIHTIENYCSYLQNAYLIFLIERFSFKLKKQFLAPKKVYCIDTGLANIIGFKFSENKGFVFENIVALELLRRKSYYNPLSEIFYWKDYQGREVDFVVKEGLRVKQLIQVTYASAKDEIEQRELKALVKASELLKCKDLLIITWDYQAEEKFKGKKTKFIPLWKWLLFEKI